MSEAVATKPSDSIIGSEDAVRLRDNKWLIPLLITISSVFILLTLYWTFRYRRLFYGFAIIIAVYLSALPTLMCFVQNVSRRRQLSKLNELSELPVAATTHYRTAVKAIESVNLVVGMHYLCPIFLYCFTLFIGFTATLVVYSKPGVFVTQVVLLGGLSRSYRSEIQRIPASDVRRHRHGVLW
jgi:hypothetical protein